jgi:hypothetical protein
MGKLTAEQKVREYNRGQKAASEGRSRSWSEPWAYPFESDQHYGTQRGIQPGLWNNRRDARVCPTTSSVMTVRVVEKIPKTKDEIQCLIIAELRTFAQCEKAWGIVVVPIVDDTGVATWTVSRFHRGQSNAYACDRALQRIVPHYQRLYDLAQKH